MARILVVDDDAQVRAVLRRMLEGEGHTIDEAAEGALAVERYRETRADLLIVDIYMPERGGLETILELRDRYPEIKIIAASGGEGQFGFDPLETATHFGVVATLTKPFEKSQLLATVEDALTPPV